ncbi:MAG: hypothetical protein ACYDGW_09580 [Vulcanimicrobiaceae bacterium]
MKVSVLLTALFLGSMLAGAPAQAASMSGMSMLSAATAPPNATEKAYITRVAHVLLAKYPTVASARAAGYFKMTGIMGGTAIYFDRRFSGITPLHPNFLWYSRQGRLVGLDYEYPQSRYPKPPVSRFPIGAARWTVVHEHAHIAYRLPNGTVHLRGIRAYPNLRSGKITPTELTADKVLPAGATLIWAYFHPTCWDLGFWLVPNPKGAFADLNPLVP